MPDNEIPSNPLNHDLVKGKEALSLVHYRSRFLRKFYGGVRLKSYYFSSRACDGDLAECPDAVYGQFPGIIDISLGKDESVTAGELTSWVFRFEANYPLPFAKALNVFGGFNTALKKNDTTLPGAALLTPRTESILAIHNPAVLVRDLPLRTHDYFRIGIGIDFLELLKRKPAPKAAGQTPAP